MAEHTIPVPGDGNAPFITEEEACAWLKVSDDSLDRACERLPWLHPRKMGKRVSYDPVEIGLLAEAIKRGIVDAEIFSRHYERPEDLSSAQERPRAPGGKDAKQAVDKA